MTPRLAVSIALAHWACVLVVLAIAFPVVCRYELEAVAFAMAAGCLLALAVQLRG